MDAKDQLVEMFERMVARKDANLIEHYYHPDFLLHANGLTLDYDSFAARHRAAFQTEISYAIDYDDDAWVSAEDRVAGRIWITTARPGEDPVEIQVMVVATLLGSRFHRLWELTWPDWSPPKAIERHESSAG